MELLGNELERQTFSMNFDWFQLIEDDSGVLLDR